MDNYSYLSNAHSSYIDELYADYKKDPENVDKTWQRFFEGFEFAQEQYGENGQATATGSKTGLLDDKEIRVRALIHAYRSRGHLRSKTNPVRERRDRKAILDLPDFNLSESDLDTEFDAGEEIGIGRAKLKDIVAALKNIYEGNVGFEYLYIREPEVLDWFKKKSEKDALSFDPTTEDKKRILRKLNQAVVFENFLHTKYLGQKRFSLEGGETTIPALDSIIHYSADLGVEEVIIGMAHRGRLNVLANIMGKTYEHIFNEFEGQAEPDLTMGDGDVKYHMGYSSQIETENGKEVNVKLSPNPSHLEAVDPVVEGFARAKLDGQYNKEHDKVLPILIHGDAAIAGQGVVYEVTQMSQLDGYHTGGTIHFVINNQVGFTTDFDDARSSIYSTDVAKVIDAPVLHVNGDDPEAVVFCVKLAVEYRQRWHKDIFIDMVCYRRHGHNESDEPKFTQPSLYNIISKHPNPREVYNKKLVERGEVDAKLAKQMDKEFRSLLQDRLNMVKEESLPYHYQQMEKEWKELRRSEPKDFEQSPETGIDEETIKKIGEALTFTPEGFKPLKQIEKALKIRKEEFFKTGEFSWASAELMAYGSILLENRTVRLTGQDVQRGTFSHRHAIIRDANSGEGFNSLNHMSKEQGSFEIYNSLLSEFAVMGFEFGYAMANPSALTIWEAQFGDFANGAQVIIDQFLAPSETKWQRMNGLVLLLPHGYEGQGPEHSNARPERFLQLCAEYNMQVVNITEASNFFHALRRQLAWEFRKPLIVMSPKSLLRSPKVVSPKEEFTSGRFREVLDDKDVDPKKVRKVVLCTGKLYYDLIEARKEKKSDDVALIRVEQLYPFPEAQVNNLIEKKYTKAKEFAWAQEEPANMGYYSFLFMNWGKAKDFTLISRKPSASPATGYPKVHKEEQDRIIEAVFK
ncbi:2-oxoglutarate dehydrogenase E1 component [Mangrovivirga sp. M17]|uniref:oxoglutarate dehydrogenase (succinyl-transferring) n=1 Tax=Mangrovivirga halotolerans TaxID=2993936 RepID=A0ABT3RSW7_9BACT|nr:2-oxoglutarate dehydrogenase E1 component [Mangrovivirga halotolerans]MCX2744448.1 2-oxoglutarate dehydrogenase E1 component [Mangrovivirga halotolerans]